MAARKFCDKCGRPQQRTLKEWEEVLEQEKNSWSYDLMFETAPPEVRDRLFKSLAGKGAFGRIAKILSLVKQKDHPEDVKWAAHLLDGAGKRKEAIMTCLEFMKKRPEAKAVVEKCAELIFAGANDDLASSAPGAVREAVFRKLEQAKQFERLFEILSAIPNQAKTDGEWEALLGIAAVVGQMDNAISACFEFIKASPFAQKTHIVEALIERCAALLLAGSNDILISTAPDAVREVVFKTLGQTKQSKKRMLDILSAIPDEIKTEAEWTAVVAIADGLGSLEGILGRIPISVKRKGLDTLIARGFHREVIEVLSDIGEGAWGHEHHRRWFESCLEVPEMKANAVKGLGAIRRGGDGEKILELYYSRAVALEAQGRPGDAMDIFKHFVDDNVPYKDAFSRYMRLAGGTLPPAKAKGAPAAAGDETRVAAPSVSEKYELIREIGRGGMGVVYEAVNRQIKKRVALKKMKEELALNLREKERFLAEAQRVADLHHPNIVDIYDICEQDGNVYLVFELVKGETVDEMLNRGKRPAIKEALRIACDVCRALEYAHGRRIIHRDIKPSNIMLASDGFVKVMDFGIAREAHDTLSRLTHVETSGTFSYMAPEQHLGAYDAGSDIYALGATLYEMLTLEPPFRGPDFLAQKREMVFKPLRDRAPEVPEELEKIVRRCLEAERGKRFQTAAAIKEALEGL